MPDVGYLMNKRTTGRTAETVHRVLDGLPRVPRTERRVYDDALDAGDAGPMRAVPVTSLQDSRLMR